MDATDPVNKPLVRAWAQWALVWLTFFPLVGVLVSIQFHNPEFLGGTSWFTFGRLRPVHTNGVIFGSFTTAFVGLLYYFVPRLCGTPLYKVEWGWWLLWMWNALLVLGPVVSIIKVTGEEEAIRVANDTEYGLSSAVFTRNVERGVRVALQVKAGMTHVNDQPVNDLPNCPFGGEKNSGLGRFGGDWIIEEFTTDHWVSVQHTPRQYPF